MTSDNERREVARRLRELDYAHFQESLICAYLDALGIKGHEDWVGIAHRLADLIEPPARCPHYMYPCCRTDAGGDYIDRDALLALAEEMDRDGKIQRERQKAGEHWFIDGLDVVEYARCIREALGVSDA